MKNGIVLYIYTYYFKYSPTQRLKYYNFYEIRAKIIFM